VCVCVKVGPRTHS